MAMRLPVWTGWYGTDPEAKKDKELSVEASYHNCMYGVDCAVKGGRRSGWIRMPALVMRIYATTLMLIVSANTGRDCCADQGGNEMKTRPG